MQAQIFINETQRRDRKAIQDQKKCQGPEKWKLTEIIICYSDEYGTDITDILSKTTSQEVSQPLLINRCTLG